MLTGLVGKPVAVSPGAPVTPEPDRPVAVADLRRPAHGRQRAVRHGPRRVGVHRRPLWPCCPRGRQDAVEEDGELSRLLVEALHEVVNVLSALFNTPGAPHSKLNKLVAPRRRPAGRHRRHARRLQPARPADRGARLRQGRALPRPAVRTARHAATPDALGIGGRGCPASPRRRRVLRSSTVGGQAGPDVLALAVDVPAVRHGHPGHQVQAEPALGGIPVDRRRGHGVRAPGR